MFSRDLFDAPPTAVDLYQRKADLLVEPALSAAAGIQPEPSVDGLLEVFVGVAEHDQLRVAQLLRQLALVVDHQNPHAAEPHTGAGVTSPPNPWLPELLRLMQVKLVDFFSLHPQHLTQSPFYASKPSSSQEKNNPNPFFKKKKFGLYQYGGA